MKPKIIISSLTIALLSVSSIYADSAAVAKKLSKFPPAASEALKKAAGTATIDEVSIEKDGKVTVYEAVLSETGKPSREISVTADGKINAEEETVPLDQVPEGAKKAIEAGAKGSKIDRVNRINRADGSLTYEARYVNKGKMTEVEFLEDGKPKPE